MSRSRHTEAQVIGALKQVEAGRAGLSLQRKKRKHGVRMGQPLRSWTQFRPAERRSADYSQKSPRRLE